MLQESKSSNGLPCQSDWCMYRNRDYATTPEDVVPQILRRYRDEEPSGEVVVVDVVSAAELAQLSGVSESEVSEMVAYGALSPMLPLSEPWHFPARCVPLLCRARGLRDALGLDGHELALALVLIFEIKSVEAELRLERALRRPSTDEDTAGKSEVE